MISKRIFPSYWFGEHEHAHLIGVHSRGLDRAQMQKVAAAEFLMKAEIKPEKGHSFLHIISLGAGEYYGPNNNADWFNKTACDFRIPAPLNPAKSVLHLDGGLEKYHNTFAKYAHVYREHHNGRKGGQPQGEVVAETLNPVMHRGELIIKVPDELWAEELHKLANGDPLFFSMGAGVPADFCAYCGNEAKTRASYCQHLRYDKLRLTKEGHQIFAINDQPYFHDISLVSVPADRIAFGLRKVASTGDVDFTDPENDWLPFRVIDKIGSKKEALRAMAIEKLSEMEKRFMAQGVDDKERILQEALDSEDLPADVIERLSAFPIDSVLSELQDQKVLLPPKSFIRIVIKKPRGNVKGLDDIPTALKSLYSDLQGGEMSDILHDSTYEPGSCTHGATLRGICHDLAKDHAIDGEPVSRRIIIVAIRNPREKVAGFEFEKTASSAESRYLAREYAKYQLSFLTGVGVDKYAREVVLKNIAQNQKGK